MFYLECLATKIGWKEEGVGESNAVGIEGTSCRSLCRREGFSSATFYKWRAKFGGMETSDAKRLRDLEAENNRLKKLLAEAVLDNEALKVAFGVKR